MYVICTCLLHLIRSDYSIAYFISHIVADLMSLKLLLFHLIECNISIRQFNTKTGVITGS